MAVCSENSKGCRWFPFALSDSLLLIRSLMRFALLPLCLCTLLIAGCGGSSEVDIAPVTGTVTLNGEPLAEAYVFFTPKAEGRLSMGVTNDQGVYELKYRGTDSGAVVGDHIVGISTVAPESAGTERVPAAYLQPGALSATVTEGDNTIDFALEGKASDKKVGEENTESQDSV